LAGQTGDIKTKPKWIIESCIFSAPKNNQKR